jgi:hypothetical protein
MAGARCARTIWLGVAAAVAHGAASAGGVVPSTNEAVARGLVYLMQNYPQQAGLLGLGCGFADLDSDGDPDVVILGAADAHVGIFENDGSGFFTDRSAGSGIPTLPEASGFAAADYDGDGDLDLYFTQMGLANVLVRNDGGFQFANVTALAGVGDDGAGTGPCWGDFDGNTYLDLYVPNYNGAVPGTQFKNNRLYRNNGDGTFADVSVAQTVDDHGYGFQAVWFDYDKDGDVDLYLSNDRGHQAPLFRTNQLWRNDGGQMVNVSVGSGADVGLFSMGIACGDFDFNRWPDLYVTNLAGYADGYNPLLLNQGDGTFVEASAAMGVDHWISSWGAIFHDFDNNGFSDLYVNNQFVANTLYLSTGVFPCFDVTAAAGVGGNNGVSFCSAVADVDGDGDLDLLLNNLNFNVQLFINHEGELRHWVKYRMAGQGANVYAVGGFVDTRTEALWQMREVLAGGNGYLGQNELTIHVGLGSATVIDEVFARWPGGATTRTLTGLPADRTWTLWPPEALGDADRDGAVTLEDYPTLAECFETPFEPGCEIMDFDGDSDVDPTDAGAFLAAYGGPLHDCDASGQPDLVEILVDPSLDLDGTGVPDACEDAGDLNGDGTVGITDLLSLLVAWGPCPGAPAACPADLSGDGIVGIADLLAMLANWG